MDLFKKEEPNTQANNSSVPAEKKGGFGNFLHGSQPPAKDQSSNDGSKDIAGLIRRMRINEERAMNLRKKTQVIEHNMLINQKKLISELKFLNNEINDLKLNFEELKVKMIQLSQQLETMAKKEDFHVLERYISMWEPVNFVTRREVERIVQEKIKENMKSS
ncbi:MAG: hypothetical protein ACMXX5_02280 [Candidatus Woesearchaeota archaeon]